MMSHTYRYCQAHIKINTLHLNPNKMSKSNSLANLNGLNASNGLNI